MAEGEVHLKGESGTMTQEDGGRKIRWRYRPHANVAWPEDLRRDRRPGQSRAGQGGGYRWEKEIA